MKQLIDSLSITILLLAFVLCLHSCNSFQKKEELLIGFSQCCEDAWRDMMEDEMERERAFHPDIKLEVRVADDNSQKQIQQIQELVDLGVDLLIIAPNESQPLTPIVEQLHEQDLPVILIDRKVNSEKYAAFVGADNYEVGLTAGKHIANLLPEGGKIIEIWGLQGSSPAQERHQGFIDAITKVPNLEVVARVNGRWEAEYVMQEFPDVLMRHPGVNLIYAHNDRMALGAYQVADSMGVAQNLRFIGVDAMPGYDGGIQAVEDHKLDASLLYPTGGVEAIRLAVSILYNLPYEKRNTLQTTVIDSTNARMIHFQLKKVADLQENIDDQVTLTNRLEILTQDQRTVNFILIFSLVLSFVLGGFLWQSLSTTRAVNKRLELKNKEVLDKQEQVVQMSEQVQKATQAKVNFFTNISHEFRTPLTLILGFAQELMQGSSLNVEARQGVNLIQENALRLLRLINQLMDFRKIESEKMELRASENDLVAFVQNIMQSYYKIAQKRSIDFKLVTREKEFPLWFDVNMLDKVLFNLLSNAFKFTPDGGQIQLILSIDQFEHVASIQVEDSGMGLSPEETQHIFEPFYQTRAGRRQGTGLGLPLSRALVQLHHGDLTVTSIKGKGSRFNIILPLGNTHLKPEQLAETAANLVPPSYFEEMNGASSVATTPQNKITPQLDQRLLLIEDNENIQNFLYQVLSPYYQIIQALDGLQGYQLAIEETPDLIVCDVMLPGKNGMEIAKDLKADLRTSHIPLIILTAQSAIEHQIEGTKAGADAYLTKPFNVELLKEKIKNLLHNRQILKGAFSKTIVAIQESDRSINKIDQQFIHRFVNYIEANYTRQDLQVTDLCEELKLSRSQLYRKVKALLGQSISDYIQNTRLKKAEELLKEGKLSVAEIAYHVGYTSPDYFSTVFKSKYNITPSKFNK